MTARTENRPNAAGTDPASGRRPGARRPGRTSRTQLKLFEAAMVIMSEKGPTQIGRAHV